MLRTFIFTSFFLAANVQISSANNPLSSDIKLENLRPSLTYMQCAKMNRQAGFSYRGKGSKSKNFIINDACMQRGGIY